MRAVRVRDGSVEVASVPVPTGPGVRVRIRAAGICGSDLHMLALGFPVAGTLGHEMAGLTDDDTPVAIEPIQPCGACDACVAGDTQLCRLGPQMMMGTALDGGMADEVRVPASCLVPLPSGVSVGDACLVEPLAVAVHGLRIAGGADRVAVVGGGSIGLCAVAAARDAGARVDLEARHPLQRLAGGRLGAGRAPDGEYPLVVDAAGSESSLARAVALCRPGGTLLLLSTPWEGLVLPGFALCLKEVRVVPASLYGRAGGARDVERAAAILGRTPGLAASLITHRFPLEGAVEAFRAAGDRAAGAIKVVLEPR